MATTRRFVCGGNWTRASLLSALKLLLFLFNLLNLVFLINLINAYSLLSRFGLPFDFEDRELSRSLLIFDNLSCDLVLV